MTPKRDREPVRTVAADSSTVSNPFEGATIDTGCAGERTKRSETSLCLDLGDEGRGGEPSG